jgi:adenylate kinase
MLIALTGTPGTGKTSIAQYIKKHGISVISLNELAISHDFITGKDIIRDSFFLDLDKINVYIEKEFRNIPKPILIEGHATHWLTQPQWIIILRCHPNILAKRLSIKQWNSKKIKENVESEILDIILCEATEIHQSTHLLEINTTKKTSQQVGKIILGLIENNFSNIKDFGIGKIDWSEEILKKPE